MNPKFRTLLVAACFAIIVVAFFQDVLLHDRVLVTSNTFMWSPWRAHASSEDLSGETYRTDAARTYFPRRVELTRSIASGRFPLWNPYVFSGCPFFADPQSRVLYPISLMLVPVDPAKAMGYDVAIHFLIAMLGMYLFLRSAGGTMMGGMVGGLAYGLSSFFFLRTGHPTFVASASWIPWMFYAFERSKRSERSGGLLLILFMGLGYLAGMTQVFMFGIAALIIYALEEGAEGMRRGDRSVMIRNLRVIGTAGFISALAVAVNLVPFAELILNSRSLSFSYELMREEHLWKPVFLLRSLVPDFFGNPVEGTSWVGLIKGAVHPYNSGFLVYCGAGGLGLALAGLVFLRRSRHIRGMFLLLILSVALATSALLLKAIYAVFPPAAYSQIDRVSVIACFAIAGLAGKGISLGEKAVGAGEGRSYTAVLILLAGVVVAGYVVFAFRGGDLLFGLAGDVRTLAGEAWFQKGSFKLIGWVGGHEREWFAYERVQVGKAVLFTGLSAILVTVYVRWRRRVGVLVVGALLLLSLAADLMVAARRYYVTQPSRCLRRTEGIDFISSSLAPPGTWRLGSLVYLSPVFPANLPQVYGIHTFEGLNAVYPSAHSDRVSWARGSGDALGAMGTATGRLGDLMAVRMLVGDRALAEAGFATGFRPVYEGDIYVYENADALPKSVCIDRDVFAGNGSRVEEDGEVKLIEHLEDLRHNICGQAVIERYTPEDVEIAVETDVDCVLLFQDTYYPGWKAYVDGEAVTILRTDLGIRALALEKGSHRVHMTYSPGSLKLGLGLTIVGLALILVYAIKAKSGPASGT